MPYLLRYMHNVPANTPNTTMMHFVDFVNSMRRPVCLYNLISSTHISYKYCFIVYNLNFYFLCVVGWHQPHMVCDARRRLEYKLGCICMQYFFSFFFFWQTLHDSMHNFNLIKIICKYGWWERRGCRKSLVSACVAHISQQYLLFEFNSPKYVRKSL